MSVRRSVLFGLLVLLSNVDTYAQEEYRAYKNPMMEPHVSMESMYLESADIKNYNGGTSIFKNTVNITSGLVGFSYTNLAFNWNNVSELPFGNKVGQPIEQIHKFTLSAKLPYKISDDMTLFNFFSVSSYFEKETDDSYGGGVFSFISYKMDQESALRFGILANYHPVRTLILPVVGYSYGMRRQEGLQAVIGFPSTYIGYRFNPDLRVHLGILFSNSLAKLSDGSTIESAGYIENTDYLGKLGFVYDMSDTLKVEANVLYSIYRELNIYNSFGNKIQSYTVQPAAGASFKLIYSF